jgi:hypothetical protein
MPSAFIDDGYTLTATIHSDAGTFEEFPISYRQMSSGEHAELITRTDKQPWSFYSRQRAEWIAKKLVSWGLSKSDGSLVEINADNVLKILDEAVNAIWKHVAGDVPAESGKNLVKV